MQTSKDSTSNACVALNAYYLRPSVKGLLRALYGSMDGAYKSLLQAVNTGSASTIILVLKSLGP
jgi:hypothetical protein